MDPVDALVAASDPKMRARLCSALGKWRLSFAENTEEAVVRLIGRARRSFLIWDLNPSGEFDRRVLDGWILKPIAQRFVEEAEALRHEPAFAVYLVPIKDKFG